jgi:ribosomal protein S18 acetylase RimI-like enzyme
MLREYVAWIGHDLAFQEIEFEIETLPGYYDRPGGALLVAEDSHRLVGMIALRALDQSVCELKRLFVRSHARGHGLGKDLVMHILEEAQRLNYDEIRLDTLPMMRHAQSLYASLGFEEIEPYYDTPIEGTRFMAKRL